jgi:hypothetical protein
MNRHLVPSILCFFWAFIGVVYMIDRLNATRTFVTRGACCHSRTRCAIETPTACRYALASDDDGGGGGVFMGIN